MIDHAACDLYYIITVSSSSREKEREKEKNYMVFNVHVCAGDWENFFIFFYFFSINIKRYAERVRR